MLNYVQMCWLGIPLFINSLTYLLTYLLLEITSPELLQYIVKSAVIEIVDGCFVRARST